MGRGGGSFYIKTNIFRVGTTDSGYIFKMILLTISISEYLDCRGYLLPAIKKKSNL